MRVCGNCQSEVPDGSPTCPRCGAELPKGFFAALVEGVFGKRTPPSPLAPPTAAQGTGEPFEFEVEDVFTITGRGTVATGRVTRGRIAVGDEISFRAPKGETVKRRIAGIEAFRRTLQEAREGETVGLLLAKPVPLDVLVRGVRFERV